MTGSQKNIAAEFLDIAEAALGSGFLDGRRVYEFPGNPESDSGKGIAVTEAGPEKLFEVPPEPDSSGDFPDSLDLIKAEVCRCRKCPLAATRKNAVPGEGVSRPIVLVVGEGPGADEDATGRPFVGRAGQLLDKMLSSIGLSRETNCFIANIVKCRPPENREPAPEEILACAGFLERQIRLLSPLLILSAGKTSAKTLLRTERGITSIRGTWSTYREIPLLPTFHPSYLLRDEKQKVFAWEDMKSLCLKLCGLDSGYEAATRELRLQRKIVPR